MLTLLLVFMLGPLVLVGLAQVLHAFDHVGGR